MKTYLSYLFLILCFTLFIHFSFAQKMNCTEALSDYLFQSKKNFIEGQSIQKSKLEAALKFSKENCLSTAQIKLIILLFIEDSERLIIAKNAYNSSVDKENFHQIYDIFSTFSSAILLYDFVKSKESYQSFTFSHSSNTHSSYFVSTEEFQEIKEVIKSEIIDRKKNEKLRIVLKKYPPCFSINQIKELMSLYDFSKDKLEFTKIMYQYILPNDKRRYYLLADEFSYFDKKELLEYIDNN